MKIYPNEQWQLHEQADVIDEASETITYLGFFRNGVVDENEDVDQCKILKIETIDNITTRKWADAEHINYNKNWTERATDKYTYKLKR